MTNSTYRILSFDGGGVRTILTAQILAMLAEEVDFLSKVDLFAGTSGGAMIAMCLASGQPPKRVLEFYENPDDYFPRYSKMSLFYFHCKYSNEAGKKRLENQLSHDEVRHNDTLDRLPKHVVVTSCKLSNDKGHWVPCIFSNLNSKEKPPTLFDAVMRSSAAPTYFPSYQGYIDGAVASQNPSMAALSLACDPSGGAKKELPDIRLLSLGSGYVPRTFETDEDGHTNAGPLSWLNPFSFGLTTTPTIPLFSLVMDTTVCLVEQNCKRFLGKNFLRFDPLMEEHIDLDATEKVHYLEEYAKAFPKKHPKEWEQLISWTKENFS